MDKLKIRCKTDTDTDTKTQRMARLNADSYEKVMEVAEESGESMRSVASKMIDYAYKHIVFISDEE